MRWDGDPPDAGEGETFVAASEASTSRLEIAAGEAATAGARSFRGGALWTPLLRPSISCLCQARSSERHTRLGMLVVWQGSPRSSASASFAGEDAAAEVASEVAATECADRSR